MIKVKVLVDTKLCKKDEIISIPPEYVEGLVRSGCVEVVDKTITKTKSGYVKK